MAMLVIVKRASIVRLFRPSPQYSIAWYRAPSTPIFEMM